MILRPASIWNFLEKKIFRPHLRQTEWQTPGVGPGNLCFNKPPDDSNASSSLKILASCLLPLPAKEHSDFFTHFLILPSLPKGTISLTGWTFSQFRLFWCRIEREVRTRRGIFPGFGDQCWERICMYRGNRHITVESEVVSRFASQLCHLQHACNWSTYLASPGLSFLICKMEIKQQ